MSNIEPFRRNHKRYRNNNRKPDFVSILIVFAIAVMLLYLFFSNKEEIINRLRSIIPQAENAIEIAPYTEDELYVKVLAGLLSGETSVNAGISTAANIENVAIRVYDTPEIFWLSNNYTITTVGINSYISFSSIYDDIDSKKLEIERVKDDILLNYPSEGTDFDKVLYLHDELCRRLTYVDDGSEDVHNLYGALVNGKCVCEGYAKAFSYLLTECGFENDIYSGNAFNGEYNGPHGWNGVTLDGEYYYFDVTWDDADDSFILYDYFGLTSSEIMKNHTFDDKHPVKPTSATDNNYFIHMGYFINEYNEENLVNIIKNQGDSIIIKTNSIITYTQLNNLMTNALKLSDILSKAKPGYKLSSYSYSCNDDTMSIRLILNN